ncbi:alpha-keto acid decarboxylase family protein [Chitinimonas koreensis]|uniref:alpha-keto acid decarboxylase family protein n=1 Tax=Chitinimonas koreensis TaxID=356302 RepID=UPI000418748D|nr:thiamine pyrophosphate-binding protein [Chitinimonas koreensis]QNM97069.1 alpha-keto acid decarboxylase family protein [Chitinimonas koreensis]
MTTVTNQAAANAASAPFTVAQYLLTRLVELGVSKVFQVPGDYVSKFMAALDAFPGIEAVGDVHELGAGYAADGYARALGGFGAVSVQYGVGSFSALNAVAGAYVERNPVVVISASPSTANRQVARQQGILFHHSTGDFEADRDVFAQVTVASEVLRDAALAPGQIDAALVAALTHRQPVYLEAYQNVWGDPCRPPEGRLAPLPPASDLDALKAALDLTVEKLKAAQRPLLLLGVEIARYGLAEQAQQLVDQSGLQFTTTLLGKTVLDESQPAFIGTYAGPASIASTREIVNASDFVLALGAIFTDDYLYFMGQHFDAMTLSDDQGLRIGAAHYRDVAMQDFLAGLLSRVAEFARPPIPGPNTLPLFVDESVDKSRLDYNTFFAHLTDHLFEHKLTRSTRLILGESSSLYVASNISHLPAGSFIGDAAWGSLGHETGCAIGVALATGAKPVVVAGDGGFMMVCQSLSTLARNRVESVVFVMSNQVYAIEQAFVDDKAFLPDGEFAPFDVLPAWDYAGVAAAFGARSFKVDSLGQLGEVLTQAFAVEGGPALVEVAISDKDLAPQIKRLVDNTP